MAKRSNHKLASHGLSWPIHNRSNPAQSFSFATHVLSRAGACAVASPKPLLCMQHTNMCPKCFLPNKQPSFVAARDSNLVVSWSWPCDLPLCCQAASHATSTLRTASVAASTAPAVGVQDATEALRRLRFAALWKSLGGALCRCHDGPSACVTRLRKEQKAHQA